jgi:hypothetical protein
MSPDHVNRFAAIAAAQLARAMAELAAARGYVAQAFAAAEVEHWRARYESYRAMVR